MGTFRIWEVSFGINLDLEGKGKECSERKVKRAPRDYCALEDMFSEGEGIINEIFLQISEGKWGR